MYPLPKAMVAKIASPVKYQTSPPKAPTAIAGSNETTNASKFALVLVPRDAHEEAFSWQGSLGLAGFSGPEYRAGLRRLVGKEPGPDT